MKNPPLKGGSKNTVWESRKRTTVGPNVILSFRNSDWNNNLSPQTNISLRFMFGSMSAHI